MKRTDPPPPIRPKITERLRAMRPKDYEFFTQEPQSVRSVITRLCAETGWQFTTASRGGDGIQVWRLK